MDYVVGSVAALISGNVTPNRPKLVRRALTPTKHQASPNVTPKSELVEDRSIFLSPSVQKKKAIVKKSPKRIFQNPDLDVTSETENSSPKADKVKKHLKEDLNSDNSLDGSGNIKSKKKLSNSSDQSPNTSTAVNEIESPQSANENTPKKKKRNKGNNEVNDTTTHIETPENTPKKKKREQPMLDGNKIDEQENIDITEKKSKKKINKSTVSQELTTPETNVTEQESSNQDVKSPKKKNKKKKKSNHQSELTELNQDQESPDADGQTESKKSKKKKKADYVNPNAITTKDSDSEHESDDEIVSENEEANKEILDTGPMEESSDEEDAPEKKKVENKEKIVEVRTEEEIKRTLFVGNVPFSKKCKKEVKKIFSKYGDIETVRIRTVPVKDARVTPKLAVIRSELHPERTTVNVYVKFKDPASVDQALVENNSVLNDCHLRVSRSDHTGAEHDPRCSVFVGNVPFALEDESLREKFAKCGEIASVRIIRDKKTNAGKGFAYVNFASKDGVELALALPEEDLTIKNRILRVKRCTQLTHKQKNNEPRNKKGFPVKRGPQGVQGKGQFGNKGFKKGGQPQEGEGAFRRIMNKRQNQDTNEGPPIKRQRNINQPNREKKVRKEFVGMTSEKKKKHTFDKGHKKKKALSEILSKKYV